MTETLISNLSKLDPDGAFPKPTAAGEWERVTSSLAILGRSLDVETETAAVTQGMTVRAIADPWAQVRTFADALIDTNHSIHDHVAVPQWRGLIALFALQRLRDYKLEYTEVVLDGSQPLDGVLTQLTPNIALGDNAKLWTPPYVLYLEPEGEAERPKGVFKPA